MTDHAHHPPIQRNGARWLCRGKVIVTVDGRELPPMTRDEATQLAKALLEVLRLERD